MTTHSGDHTLKKAGTYLVNKAHVLKTRVTQDELERAIWKTTSSKIKVPNEKHMERLLAVTYQMFASAGELAATPKQLMNSVIERLEKRMHTHEWVVTLKTLLVFHRLLKDASTEMHDAIIHYKQLFNINKSKDLSDAEYGRGVETFVKGYFRYLEERCECAKATTHGIDVEAQRRIEEEGYTEMFAGMPLDQVIQATEFFNAQLKALTEIPVETLIIDNPTVALAYMYIMQDSRQVTAVLTDRLLSLLARGDDMDSEQKRRLLAVFTQYNSNVSQLNKTYSMLKTISAFGNLPQLAPIPMSNVEAILSDAPPPPPPPRKAPDVEVCRLEDLLGPPPPPAAPAVSQTQTQAPPAPPPKPSQQNNLDDLFNFN